MSSKNNDDQETLPVGWARATMESLGELFCGTSPSTSEVNQEGNGTPYVTGPEQWDGVKLHMNKWTTAPRKIVGAGHIFVTVKGAGVGTLFPGQPAAIGRDIYAFKPRIGVDWKFVEHALRFSINDVIREARGDIPGLSRHHILDHSISVPPSKEQKRIADRIDELFTDLDAGVAALVRVQKKLKRYRAALLHAAVTGRLTADWRSENGDGGENGSLLLQRILKSRKDDWERQTLVSYEFDQRDPPPNWRERYKSPTQNFTEPLPDLPKSWTWASHDQVGDVQLGRQRSPKHHFGEHMRPYLRVANVYEDRIETGDVLEMNFTPKEFATYELRYGDLLLNEGQSMELIGRPAMFRDEVSNCCFQNTLVRQRTFEGLDPHFALIVLLAQYRSGRYRKIARITTSIAHLGADRFKQVEFPLPPVNEQKRIVELVDERMSQIDAMQLEVSRALKRSARLRQAILKAAFEGKLIPQDPDDEHASALLARIQTEVATEVTTKTISTRTKRASKKSPKIKPTPLLDALDASPKKRTSKSKKKAVKKST